jgi:hypothetical protein
MRNAPTHSRRPWVRAAIVGMFAFWARLALGPSTVAATDMSFWVAPSGGYSTYRMDSINDWIRALNPIYLPPFQYDEIEGGANLGIELGVDFDSTWFAGLEYQRLWASSESDGSDFQLSANVFDAEAGYRFQPTRSTFVGPRFGFGVLVLTDARLDHPPVELATNHGFDYEGSIDFQYRFTNRLRALARTGYRFAAIDELEDTSGEVVRRFDNAPVQVDYSGVFVKLGLTIYFYP